MDTQLQDMAHWQLLKNKHGSGFTFGLPLLERSKKNK